MTDTVHVPVLPEPILHYGAPSAGQHWIDGTSGGGGHCRLIAERIGPTGRLLAIDRDPLVVTRLEGMLPANCTVKHASYDDAPEVLNELQWPKVDGILLDLGLSSDQLADRDRGFSFTADGTLDMRFDSSQGEPAWEWLARVDERTLADTIYQFGEERFSRRIAKRIVESRKANPIHTASQLRDLIHGCVPGKKHGRIDPATRTFQALRIAVNDELGILERALERLPSCLAPQGKLLIISFHSLEDRIVKYAFRNDARLEVITRRPVQADDDEVDRNSRSRSAKLRVAELR
jgi:16S rRNA (cytosine1402-N4)-methyltransferase